MIVILLHVFDWNCDINISGSIEPEIKKKNVSDSEVTKKIESTEDGM